MYASIWHGEGMLEHEGNVSLELSDTCRIPVFLTLVLWILHIRIVSFPLPTQQNAGRWSSLVLASHDAARYGLKNGRPSHQSRHVFYPRKCCALS